MGTLPADLRTRISIVSVDISPDLRQARVSVSIRSSNSGSRMKTASRIVEEDEDDDDEEEGDDDDEVVATGSNNPVVDKRRAYSWLVENAKPLRHTLAQRLSHMKSSAPTLQFVLVDVSAAVDVMYLIDKVSKGYERETVDTEYLFGGSEDGEDHDDEEWDEEDDDFFDDDDDDQ